jgi:HK97 family phage major capsid protein
MELGQIQREIKDGFEDIKKVQTELQKDNDRRLKALEDRKTDPLLTEKLEKMNVAIDGLVEKQEKMQTALNRAPSGITTDPKEVTKKMSDIMKKYMRGGEAKLTTEEIKFYNENLPEEVKGLIVGNNEDGGYMVRPEVSNEITKKVFESSPVRQVASVISIGSDAFEELADFDEPAASWVGEVASRPETANNKLKMLRVPTHEIYANPRISQKLLEDAAYNIEAWHSGKVAEKFARAEATAFVSGDGVAKPRGFTTYASGDGYDKIEQVASASGTEIAADDLVKLRFSLFDAYQANASFLAHRLTVRDIRLLKDGEGRYLWSMEGNLVDGYMQMLLSRPLRWASDMALVTGGSAKLPVAYGDFKQGYLVVDRVGISVLRDPYSAKPHVEFYTRKRVGGGVRNFQAIKLLSVSGS